MIEAGAGDSCLATEFAAAMGRVGPFEPAPAIAVAVSGGADSMALAILTREWVGQRNGYVTALVVDHGLRQSSAKEATSTVTRLEDLGVPARLLRLSDLSAGPALAERARIGRYHILTSACREAGILHLLLGHHAADQMETLAMRVLRESQTHGLAGMAALRETTSLRLLRPLLTIDPTRLRGFLTAAGVGWIEDPSNRDLRAMRPRLRHRFSAHGPGGAGLSAAAAVGRLRSREEHESAVELARRASIRPEGFALLSLGRIGPAALSSLVQTIGGLPYPASSDRINDLAAQPRPATIAGVRIMPAGRFGDGLLIAREEAAVLAPIEAAPGVIWDNRFRLISDSAVPAGAIVGKLGPDAAGFRTRSEMPAAVLRTLPAIRIGKVLAAVPHLAYASHEDYKAIRVLFSPRKPLGGPGFVPANQVMASHSSY